MGLQPQLQLVQPLPYRVYFVNHTNYMTFPNTAVVRSVWVQFQLLSMADNMATIVAANASDFLLRVDQSGRGFASVTPGYNQDMLMTASNVYLNGVENSTSGSYIFNQWYALSGAAAMPVGNSSATMAGCYSPCDSIFPINAIGGSGKFFGTSHYVRNMAGYMTEVMLLSSVIDNPSQAALHAYAPQPLARPAAAGGTLAETVMGTAGGNSAFSTRQLFRDWPGPVATVRKASTGELAEVYATGIDATLGYTLALLRCAGRGWVQRARVYRVRGRAAISWRLRLLTALLVFAAAVNTAPAGAYERGDGLRHSERRALRVRRVRPGCGGSRGGAFAHAQIERLGPGCTNTAHRPARLRANQSRRRCRRRASAPAPRWARTRCAHWCPVTPARS